MTSRSVCLFLLVAGVVGLAAAGGPQADGRAARPSASKSKSTPAWTQAAYVKASNPRAGAQFGYAVALSSDGTTLAVAAQMEESVATGINGNQTDHSLYGAGAVYVYTRRGDAWSQQAYIKASNPGQDDQFGFNVSLSADGNTLAVSAPYEDSAATGIDGDQADNSMPNSGAVYVFGRTGTTWAQQAYIKASNTGEIQDGDEFGYSISLSGDGNTIAVGSFDEAGSSREINGPYDRRAAGTGAVYVFTRSGTSWSQQAYLKAKEGDRQDSMGCWVAISDDGNTVAAGALDEDTMVPGINVVQSGHSGVVDGPDDNSSGAAYVFVRNGTTWTEQASFKASNVGKHDWFGIRLNLSGDSNTLAVGAPNEDSAAQGINGNQNDNSADEAGAVYLFRRDGATWSQQVYFKGSNTEKFDEFSSGIALSRDGRTMAVGAHFESGGAKGINGNQADNSMPQSGAVYVFVR